MQNGSLEKYAPPATGKIKVARKKGINSHPFANNDSSEVMSRRLAIWEASNKKNADDRLTDMTRSVPAGFATAKNYVAPYEQDLARYAVTEVINKYGTFARDMKNLSQEASKVTVCTELGKQSVVYGDVIAHLSVEINGEKRHGMIQAVFIPCGEIYRVALGGENDEVVKRIETIYEQTIEINNFYQGKALRFSRNGVSFVPVSNTTLEDAILPKKTLEEYDLNVVSFLTDEKMFQITKKRSILLYGPPGTGKTTSIKALFNILCEKGVTCIFASDESFRKFSVEDVFGFINKYLAPALVVFEDIDLIAQDRKLGASAIIGPLLSALNGIESQEKPIVIVGTTNRVEILDEAVTRPCRFDRKIKVDYPTEGALKIMFEKKAKFAPPEGAIKQGKGKEGLLTGAHIEEIFNTAALLATKNNKKIKDCVKESVQIVKENFFVANPGAGFGFISSSDCIEEAGDCCKEACSPVSGNPDDGDFFK